MAIIDWSVLVLYFLGMIWIGIKSNQKNHNTDDYFLGGRTMRPWAVGLSLFATLLSTITYLAMPGEVIKHGPMMLAGLAAVPLIIWIVGWFIIPAFMKESATSGYDLLERKFGPGVRILGIALFLLLRLFWMAMVIYLTSKAVLGPVLDLDARYLPFLSLGLGLITVGYTSVGGLRAVVITDVIQTFILFFGVVLTIGIITFEFGGFSWIPTEWNPTWDPPIFWFDPDARVTIAGAITLLLCWYICTAGGDQMAIQRYLATRDTKSARGAFTISMLAGVGIQLLFLLLGFALLTFYAQGRASTSPVEADLYFPHFISNELPIGISGLVVAALLAAAMSSLSSGLNAVVSVISVDLIGRFRHHDTRATLNLRSARITSWIAGAIIVFGGVGLDKIGGTFIELTNKTSIFVAPLFCLFFLALFIPSAKPSAAWIAAFLSVLTGISIGFFEVFGLSFVWIIPAAFISGSVAGVLVSQVLKYVSPSVTPSP